MPIIGYFEAFESSEEKHARAMQNANFCRKCGKRVTDKYCPNCGSRVRSALEEYRVVERRTLKEFREACTQKVGEWFAWSHIADACWYGVNVNHRFSEFYPRTNIVRLDAYERLEERRVKATELFDFLISNNIAGLVEEQ